jgi:hypothetical protein
LKANDAVYVATAKAWVIELFQVPPDAKITRFTVASGTRILEKQNRLQMSQVFQ